MNFPSRCFNDLLQFNGTLYETFAEVARERGLIKNEIEYFDFKEEAINANPDINIRWLFCILVRSDADCSILYKKYFDKLMEEFENEKDLKIGLVSMMNKMNVKRRPFFDDVFIVNINPFARNREYLSSLSQCQQRILSDIIKFVDNPNFPNICFLQGATGTGKTFLIKT